MPRDWSGFQKLAVRREDSVDRVGDRQLVVDRYPPVFVVLLKHDWFGRLDLDQYHYLHATRAELLRRLDRADDARVAYADALELVNSEAERRFLERRMAELPG